jgi:hypothetical protein
VAAACAVSDLMIAHDRLSPTAPRALFTHRPAALEAAAPPDDRRLYVYDYDVPGKSQQYLHRAIPFEVRRAPVGWTAPAATALAMRLALVPPSPGVWQAAGSFDRDIPGIAPDPLAELDDLLVAAEGTPAHLALLRIGAVARVATLHREGFEGLRPIGTADVLLSEPLSIFAVPEPLPRAYAVEGARTADGREALRLIAEGAFDPAREVVLADGPPVSSRLGFEGTARVIREGTDGVEIQAALGRDGFVVLVDAFDPGWKADVDGRPSPVLRANVAFRAVRVPKGRHSIAMRYRPRGVGQGLAVTSATLAAALLLGLRVSLRERARS